MKNLILENIKSPLNKNIIFVKSPIGTGKLNTISNLCKQNQISYIHVDLDKCDIMDLKGLPLIKDESNLDENKVIIVSGVQSKKDLIHFKSNKIVLIGEKCPHEIESLVKVVSL